MNELISVIISVYNVEKYVQNCVDSVINQTYQNLEIIIVDDGSTDSSGRICDDMAKSDHRIAVYHKSNGGLSSARNYGMSKAKGDFYAFVDSDDAIHKDFFSVMMEAQHQTNADIVSVGMSLFYDLDELQSFHKLNSEYSIKVLKVDEILSEYFFPINCKAYIFHGLCMKVYKKALFSDIKFPEARFHEDLFVTYRLLDKATVFAYVDAPYYFYFQSNIGSIMNNYRTKNFFDECDACSEMISYFDSVDVFDGAFLHFLILHYLYLLLRSKEFGRNKDVKAKRKSIGKWIRTHIWQDRIFSLIKKIVIILCTRHIWIFALFRKVKGNNP